MAFSCCGKKRKAILLLSSMHFLFACHSEFLSLECTLLGLMNDDEEAEEEEDYNITRGPIVLGTVETCAKTWSFCWRPLHSAFFIQFVSFPFLLVLCQ